MAEAPLDAAEINREAAIAAQVFVTALAEHMLRVNITYECPRMRGAVHRAIRERIPQTLDLVLLPPELA
jgi:hypothetical protein